MTLGLIDEAVSSGARQSEACEVLGIDPRTVQRWKRRGVGEDRRAGPKSPPRNKLTAKERAQVLDTMNSPEFRDVGPNQIVPTLADRGEYIASESTMYRILRSERLLAHREPSRPASKRHRPDECAATGPNQVWSWDITYLKSPVLGAFFYLYVVTDVWSRKIVGWTVEAEETAENAEAMLARAHTIEGVAHDELVLHSDNGSPMKAATLLTALEKLGVATSFSRPSVSNDNPYSEALFRTVKYRPEYPRRPFKSIEEARQWLVSFERWYNTKHLHSAIKFVAPADRHDGDDVEILDKRHAVYQAAEERHPERWTCGTRNWRPIEKVVLNPDTKRTVNEAA